MINAMSFDVRKPLNASGGSNQKVDQANNGPMVQLGRGSGDGCLLCVGMKNGLIPQNKLEEVKAAMYAKIMAHEQAHASAAGAFGGAIHIDYDSNGIAIGGHVPITIPGLNKLNPEESIQAYQQIMNAALAPGDPSGQDMAVAASASRLILEAQALQGKLQVAMQNKPNGQLEPFQVNKTLNPN